jgi:hypothetical protein
MASTQSPNQMNMRRLDLGAAFEFARNDPQWMMRCVSHGLMNMIPIMGMLCMWGWGRRIYHLARTGQHDALPEPDWGKELTDGVAPLAAVLNSALLIIPAVMFWLALTISFVTLTESSGGDPSGLVPIVMLVLQLGIMVMIGASQLLMPELVRRGYNGELLPLRHLGPSLRVIWANPGAYMLTCIGIMLCNVVGQLGLLFFGIGVLLTVPLGHLMSAHIVAQWDSIVEQHERGSVKVPSPEVARDTQRLKESRVETSR